jgi:deoxyadenosine/deoxycytidine kinase
MPKKPFLISIEGNIGAGKSTILEHLEKHLSVRLPAKKVLFLKEPLDIWENFHDEAGNNILQKFYANQVRYAFTFQVMAFITRLSLLRQAIKNNPEVDIIVIERSLCADKNIFMNMLHGDKIVEKIEFDIYNKWYAEYIEKYRVDAVIYMDSNPEVCNQRINKRNRNGEDNIPLDYLKKCRDFHTKWLIDTACDEVRIVAEYVTAHTIQHEGFSYPVLKIDSNQDTDYNGLDSVGNKWLDAISDFVRELVVPL